MTAFIKTDTQEWPLYEGDIRLRFPNVSFPAAFVPPDGYAPIVPAALPVFDPATENVVEITPVFSGGVWTQTWSVVAATAEQIAGRAARAAKIARDAATKAVRDEVALDSTVEFLRTHTLAEVDAWVVSNVTDLASAKTLLRKLSIICAYLARDKLNVT